MQNITYKEVTSPAFWTTQLNAAEQYRKIYTKQQRWPIWRKYYRGEWDENILPVNMFFAMERTIVPRTYFRNPGISISPAKPGLLNIAFAQILERADNKLMKRLKVKKQIKKIVRDSFRFGTGIGKLGFGAQFSPSPEYGAQTGAPTVGKRGRRVEWTAHILENTPWFLRVHPGQFLVPAGSEDKDDAPWVAHQIERIVDDVKADPRFKNTSDLGPDTKPGIGEDTDKDFRYTQPLELVQLYEIHEAWYGTVIVLAKNQNKILYEGEDELRTSSGFNFYDLIFNDDDEVFWGVPESTILEPQQLELNEIRTQAMKHRRVSIVKLLVKIGAIDETEALKLVSSDVAPIVWTQQAPAGAILPMEMSKVPDTLYQAGQQVMNDIRETVGLSRNQFGGFAAGRKRGVGSTPPTAAESRIVEAATGIRIDERRDMVADMIAQIVTDWHGLLFRYWGKEEVMDIVGPGGIKLWVEFTGQMLGEGRYETHVDPDTSLPQTRDMRMQKAIQVYSMLKSNPLIDPTGLTRYLLRELHGVEYDDLMRGLPQQAGTSRPMDISQYTKMLGNAQRLGLQQPRQSLGTESK